MNVLTNLKKWFLDHREAWLFRQMHKYYAFVEDRYGDMYPELDRYDETAGNDQKWITVHEIVVETQRDKDQLLATFQYIHDLVEIDTGYMGVNYVAHLYQCPELIRVKSD